jgi:hypothetical protein
MNDTSSATPETVCEGIPLYPDNYLNGPLKLQRNEFGLLKNVDYKFTETGHVSWREMVDPKFLYPNKDWFDLNKEPVPESIEGLEDAQLLIQLGGIKELARLRGFNSVSFSLTHPSETCVSAQCTINWIPNYENPNGCIFESTANATFDNTSGFGSKFLETIAENRSFVRAVRNFLNIHIAGADEVDKSKNKVLEVDNTQSTTPTAQSTLEKQSSNAGFKTYEEFREKFLNPLVKAGKYAPAKKPETPWLGYADIPAEECRKIISLIKKSK